MRISSAIYQNLSTQPSGDDDREVSVEEIDGILHSLKVLEDELELIIRRLRYQGRERSEHFFYFDFDIIFSAINWLHAVRSNENHRVNDSFWSSLALTLYSDSVGLLPGTVYELLRFIKREGKFVEKINNSAIADVFVDQFFRPPADDDKYYYAGTIETLKKLEYGSSTFYVLSSLMPRISKNLKNEMGYRYDEDVFQSAYFSLAVGRRRDLFLNNRVDAVNFAVATKMNEVDGKNRHLLISNSTSLQNLPTTKIRLHSNSPALYNAHHPVMSARHACLYQLLVMHAREATQAEYLAQTWSSNVQKLKLEWSERRRLYTTQRPEFAGTFVNADNLLNLFWIFEGIQDQLYYIQSNQKNALEVFDRKYKHYEYAQFMRDIDKQISVVWRGSTYYDLLEKQNNVKNIIEVFDMTARKPEYEPLGQFFEIVSGNLVVNVSGGETGFRVWFRLTADFATFYQKVQHLSMNLAQKFYTDIYNFEKVGSKNFECLMSDGKWTFIDREGKVVGTTAPLDERVNFEDILNAAKTEASPYFARYITPLFSVSYDGVMVAIHTDASIVVDVRNFVDLLLGTNHYIMRSDEAHDAIARCASTARLSELTPS